MIHLVVTLRYLCNIFFVYCQLPLFIIPMFIFAFQGCTNGKWGARCEKNCNSNCDLLACDRETAECSYGCKDLQYFGFTCDEQCNGNCTDHVCNRSGAIYYV